MKRQNRVDFEALAPGDALPEAQIVMDRQTYSDYNRLINEINPLHFDAAYARKLGYKDIVVAGVYTFSFIPQMIEAWAGKPGCISSIAVRYKSPVYIGETIVQTARIAKKTEANDFKLVEIEVEVKDNAGELLTAATVGVEL